MRLAAALAAMALSAAIFATSVSARFPCPLCVGEQCLVGYVPPTSCEYGHAKDYCGRTVCAKGPGQRCGGPNDFLGECGVGMRCSDLDGRCHGCYIGETLVCYD